MNGFINFLLGVGFNICLWLQLLIIKVIIFVMLVLKGFEFWLNLDIMFKI